MRKASTIAVFALCSTAVFAQDQIARPTYGTLVGERDGDVLDYLCTPDGLAKMNCSFVQVLFQKDHTKLEDLVAMVPDAPAEDPEFSPMLAECPNYVPALQHFIDFKEIDPTLLPDGVDLEDMQKAVAEDTEYAVSFAKSVVKVCAEPTKENIVSAFKVANARDEVTCSPFVNRYEQSFVRVSDTLWVVESSPTGECGIVNTSSFSNDGSSGFLWDYTASKVITNKAGKANGIMNCSDFNETPQPYPWRKMPKLKNCTYIE